MRSIKIIIPGDPQGKGRPKFNSNSRHAYTSQKTRDYEALIKTCYITQCPSRPQLHGGIRATVAACMAIPKGTSKKRREDMLNMRIRPTKKPDLDNIVKAVLDGLNGLAYGDDNSVVDINASKVYANSPCVEILLEEI